MASLSGTELGRYQVLERLGRGGMAEVYKGYHQNLDRHVAIKVLHGYLAEGEDFLARFEREARAVANLRHTNIVQIFDFDVEDENYYMVMELVEGGTLGQKFKTDQDTFALEYISNTIEQIAAALDYAHSQRVIHRDIKPSNIMIDDQGSVFLTDFGIARIVSGTQFTATGALIGTPAYMSPEQCKGEEIGPASDVYSLGIILYEMLTRQQPFEAETPLSVLQKHITEPIPPIHHHRQDLPPVFEGIISRSLAKEPANRYQSAGALASDLRDAVKQTLHPTQEIYPDKTTLETTVMEADEAEEDSTVQPTVVMEGEERHPDAPQGEPEPAHLEKIQDKRPPKKTKKPIPWKIIAPIGIVLVAAGVLLATSALDLTNNPSEDIGHEESPTDVHPIEEEEEPGECTDPWSCRDRAVEAWESGDLARAEEFYRDAISHVSDPITAYTPIWCEFAELGAILHLEDQLVFSGVCFIVEQGVNGCHTPDECFGVALQAWEAERLWVASQIIFWAIEKVPDDRHAEYAFLWCNRSEVYSDLGEPALAEENRVACDEWSEEILDQSKPESPWSLREKGIEARDSGDIDAAIEHYQIAISLIDSPPHEYALIWCEFAELLQEIEREDQYTYRAMCYLTQRGQDGCETVEACRDLGYAAREEGALWEAYEILFWALDKVPEDQRAEYAGLWCNRAGISEELGEIDLAHENDALCEEWSQQP